MYGELEKKIMDICRNEYSCFLYKANVVGIGCGYKVIKGIKTCEVCIQVFVKKKVSVQCLDKCNLVPTLYKGIKTDVIETGEFKTTSLKGRVRPITGGYSLGPINTNIAGSYAGLVIDNTNNKICMLSNNHIIADTNRLPRGAKILQPAPIDGGMSPRDDVATLTRFVPVKFITPTTMPPNFVDGAIADVLSPALFSRDTTYIGSPTGIGTARVGLKTQMVGSISEYLSGEVVSISATFTVRFSPGKEALYVGQLLLSPPDVEGDSGAFVFDFDRRVIGLLFASSPQYSLANQIVAVLFGLNVRLVTG